MVSSGTAVNVASLPSQHQATVLYLGDFINAAYCQTQGRSPSLWAC